MGKTPNSDPIGSNILTRLTSVMKTSASGSHLKQPTASTSMSNSNSSDFFIRMALDMFQNSKESRRNESLRSAIRSAIEALDSNEPTQTPISIFKPFQIACETGSPELATIAIDCMGKLFTYDYWGRVNQELLPTGDRHKQSSLDSATGQDDGHDDDGDNEGTENMISFVIDTICNTFVGEHTDERVQLQIIKALQAALTTSNPSHALHGAVLLKAIRTVYNTFLLSKSNDVQIVAQGTVTQMVQSIFSRIPKPSNLPSSHQNQSAQSPSAPNAEIESPSKDKTSSVGADDTVITTTKSNDSLNHLNNASETTSTANISQKTIERSVTATASTTLSNEGSVPATPSRMRTVKKGLGGAGASHEIVGEASHQAIKDAFKVFRTLCILSMKPIPAPEGTMDLRFQPVRSKLLALHLISTILSMHTYVLSVSSVALANPKDGHPPGTTIMFIDAIKEFLILSLSRNATSVIPPVFEVSMEIFGRLLLQSRVMLKKEISVFFTEIVIPILEARKTIPWYQRFLLLRCLRKIFDEAQAEGGRVLVEIYLNYDCDPEATAKENIWERLIVVLSKIAAQPTDSNAVPPSGALFTSSFVNGSTGSSPALTTANLVALTREQVRDLYSTTGDTREIKKRGLEFLVRGVLRPLVQWCRARSSKAQPDPSTTTELGAIREESDQRKRISDEIEGDANASGDIMTADKGKLGLVLEEDAKKSVNTNGFRAEDDPAAFESLKHRKQLMLEGIKRFNQKPKKGIQFLLDSGCIPARTPRDIAKFLLSTEGLSKSMIGEFLGEGEEENIAIMHAFVDEMDFTDMLFVNALRHFLQSFRLPGEAQKIDRFMLKFAERYLKGNPKNFSSADTAYVLAYSVIMLNTDQHNAQVKRRMTKADFLKNNRGIDEGKDLPVELLEGIFDEISKNEIVMKDEAPAKAREASKTDKAPTLGLPVEMDSLIFGKNKKREGQPDISKTTEDMALKTEAIFTSMMRSKTVIQRGTARRDGSGNNASGAGARADTSSTFYSASHYEHVRPMFHLVWMSVLTAISTPLQDSDDMETISLALEGFRCAVFISCLFDMDLEIKTFVSTLGKFTILNNIQEMRGKNFEAIKALLDVAYQQGNNLSESWKVIVLCVSQLEKLQIVGGLTVDDGTRSRGVSEKAGPRRDQNIRQPNKGGLLEEVAAEAGSQSMTLLVDRIFTSSAKLSGPAIVEFVRALCETSWDEISSSSDREHPRMYCLQRLVEISYYNMKRIRVEWSQLWAILGAHFNQVGSHPNSNVAFFAVDKLRQLTMKFLELEELPNFKFQKDFLRPFEEIMRNNPDNKIKDMVLACVQQIAQSKAKNLKSGWKTLLGTLLRAAREPSEALGTVAFDILRFVFKSGFENIAENAAYPEFVACVVEFCKNSKNGKLSLQAIDLHKQSITRVAEMLAKQDRAVLLRNVSIMSATSARTPHTLGEEDALDKSHPSKSSMVDDDSVVKFWMPALFGLHDVIMAADLEVRSRALQYLFETLKTHGGSFSNNFWGLLAKGVLFPTFDDLKHSGTTTLANSKFTDKEEMMVWLSTTLIQALRQLVELFSFYYDSLKFMMDGMLDLLQTCLMHENEALSRIGSTCLQQLVEHNATRLEPEEWGRIVDLFEKLCRETTPKFLFFDLRAVPGNSQPSATTTNPSDLDPDLPFLKSDFGPPPDKKEFQRLISKCALHLLVIQTLDDVLMTGPNEIVFRSLAEDHLFRLIDSFEQSYRFARAFNGYTELRTALYRMGYMKQMPNLLKQETMSVSAYMRYLAKLAFDKSPERSARRDRSEQRLVPLCLYVLAHFNSLDTESKRRNINSWKPVVIMVMNTLVNLDDAQFSRHVRSFYAHVVNLLLHDVGPEIRLVMHSLLMRIGATYSILSEDHVSAVATVSGPASSAEEAGMTEGEEAGESALGAVQDKTS